MFEDVEFERRDFDRLTFQSDFSPAGVEHHAVDLQLATVSLGFGAAENGLDACRKLAWIERLREIIVGSELEPDDAVDILSTRCEHQHWNPAFGAKSLQNLEAVEARQHDIENNKVVAALLG